MMLRPPDHIREIRPYEPGKPIEEVERELGLRDTVKLASNENPLGPSPQAVAALREALPGLHRYPDGAGFYLRNALAAHCRVPPDHVILGNGSTELVELLARTYLGAEGNAVLSEGAFIMYRIAVMAVNGNVRSVPLRQGTHDLEAMGDAIDASTRLIFIANPNNPTGTFVGRDAMDRLIERTPDSALVVVDEAYREYVEGFEPDYPDLLARLRQGGRVLVLRTFSKAYGLAGLRIGYGLGPAAILHDLERVRSPFNTSSLSQIAALAALDDREHVERSRQANRQGLQRLQEGFRELGLDYLPSVANFVLVEAPWPAREAFQKLLREGIIVRPMDAYGFARGLRVSVGTASENDRVLGAFRKLLAT
ncbi:MAG: histidinol-phosphate transaminase [Acidobacteriota bacterium]|jgi:histidinol-phosphate aminotransferase